MTKYTVWFCAIDEDASTPQEAASKAMKDAKNGFMMVDEVIEPSGIICISLDSTRIGKHWRYEN